MLVISLVSTYFTASVTELLLVCFGYVLWHINDCRLLYADSCLYIYIEYLWTNFIDNVLKALPNAFVKWFQVFLWINNDSIKHQSFLYTQVNDQT